MEKILIDTDPGQDDAVAILLALASSSQIDVQGITAVAGNVSVAQTAANVIRICELGDRDDVPIYRGAEGPLVFPLTTAEYVCGPDGLAGANLPPAKGDARSGHAVDFIIGTLRASADPLTICALGPLTNVALSLRLAPNIRRQISRIVLMGGAMNLGNTTPAAEFNFFVDPHAAAIVFAAGIPIVMVGLNLTHQAVAAPDQVAKFAKLGSAAGTSIHGMLTRPRPSGLGTAGHPMHDPCVIAYLLWPELFFGRDCSVEIETGDGLLRGRSTIDWHGRLGRPANAHVLDKVDARLLFDRMTDAIATLG
jgi:purine nucleosidase